MNSASGSWLQTDEADDVAGSIRHCLASYALVAYDDHAWKWISLSLHSALQGACVCHLVTTAVPIGAVTDKNTGEWLRHFNDRDVRADYKPPEAKIADFRSLLKRVRKPRSAGDRRNEHGVLLSDSELEWLCRFHKEIRNQFTHFTPMGWSIEVSGLPMLTTVSVRLIREIQSIGWAFRHKDCEWHGQFERCLNQLHEVALSRLN